MLTISAGISLVYISFSTKIDSADVEIPSPPSPPCLPIISRQVLSESFGEKGGHIGPRFLIATHVPGVHLKSVHETSTPVLGSWQLTGKACSGVSDPDLGQVISD